MILDSHYIYHLRKHADDIGWVRVYMIVSTQAQAKSLASETPKYDHTFLYQRLAYQ